VLEVVTRFYRTTLCVSAVFAVVRCPSVTFVDCIHMADGIVKLLVRPGSPITLVFLTPAPVPNSNSLQQERKIHGVGKFCDFRLKSPFILVAMKR